MSKKSKKGQTASAAAAVINIDTDKAIFYNKNNQLCLTIQAKPGANETRIIDVQEQALVTRISARPVDGEANKELIKYISKLLKISKCDVNLDKGSKSKNKVLQISNCNLTEEIMLDLFKQESE